MGARLVILSFGMLLTGWYVSQASTAEPVSAREPLAGLPTRIGDWLGQAAPDLDDDIVSVLGVDDYVNRVYMSRQDEALAGLYIGYHASQREGTSIHSPLNCLPGSGWTPVESGRVRIRTGGGYGMPSAVDINRYVVAKGLDRQVVLYWYQSHGRVVASEYWGRIYMVLDAIRFNRTDAALVRVVAPLPDAGEAPHATAEHRAVAFVESLFPLLGRYLPA